MAPDPGHAATFLAALDPHASTWTFQTFSDAGTDKALTRLLHGSFDEHTQKLKKLNEAGAGVFVAVNETDGKGRRKDNITRVRALFVDLDGAPIEPVQSAPTPAHIIVGSSPGKYQIGRAHV